MGRTLMIVGLVLAAGLLIGCSDSDEGSGVDPFFQVVIKVEDPQGNPVPGLNLDLTSDNPYLQDFKRDKAVTRIRFVVPVPARVQMVVEDINGQAIRDLIDGQLAAGYHEVAWEGKDYEGIYQPSGRYTFRMIGYDPATGLPGFEDSVDGLMCLVDPYSHAIGVTDSNGVITLRDKRHFPHLYDRAPMVATDENGTIKGQLEPTEDMLVAFGDTLGNGTMIIRRAIPGRGFYRFVWDPSKPRDQAAEKKAEGSDIPIPPPPVDWMLEQPYPNPYN